MYLFTEYVGTDVGVGMRNKNASLSPHFDRRIHRGKRGLKWPNALTNGERNGFWRRNDA